MRFICGNEIAAAFLLLKLKPPNGHPLTKKPAPAQDLCDALSQAMQRGAKSNIRRTPHLTKSILPYPPAITWNFPDQIPCMKKYSSHTKYA
ncbi:hypothetical protein D9M69_567380 [compost metagenome]